MMSSESSKDEKEYSSSERIGIGPSRKNRKCMMNKRRFSDEQIKSLESMFETESKLEPRMKLKLARDLDLHPRQVAIWFQNKRARWKSKQLEREYDLLKANYDALASQFESEKLEKQSLLVQLQKLHHMQGTPQDQRTRQLLQGNSSTTDGDSETKHECDEQNPKSLLKGSENEFTPFSYGRDDSNLGYFIKEEAEDLTNVMEPSSQKYWGCLNDCIDDQSSSSSQWWEFWS